VIGTNAKDSNHEQRPQSPSQLSDGLVAQEDDDSKVVHKSWPHIHLMRSDDGWRAAPRTSPFDPERTPDSARSDGSQRNGMEEATAAVSNWTTEQVCEWLAEQGFGDLRAMFAFHQVDGAGLLSLCKSGEGSTDQSPLSGAYTPRLWVALRQHLANNSVNDIFTPRSRSPGVPRALSPQPVAPNALSPRAPPASSNTLRRRKSSPNASASERRNTRVNVLLPGSPSPVFIGKTRKLVSLEQVRAAAAELVDGGPRGSLNKHRRQQQKPNASNCENTDEDTTDDDDERVIDSDATEPAPGFSFSLAVSGLNQARSLQQLVASRTLITTDEQWAALVRLCHSHTLRELHLEYTLV